MRSKLLVLLTFFISIVSLTGCIKEEDSIKFKKDYESLNGLTNANGKEYRYLNIKEENPFIITNAKNIVNKIENKETFYVYFGSKLCPWCRSVIETSIEIANKKNIEKIYYVDIWDDNANEILRDKYVLDDNGNTKKVNDGTEEYFKLLEYLGDLLPDYTYAANKNSGSKLDIKEKRIYAPTFIYIENGQAIRITSGLSDKQTNSPQELTNEILEDEQKQFERFFANSCDKSC